MSIEYLDAVTMEKVTQTATRPTSASRLRENDSQFSPPNPNKSVSEAPNDIKNNLSRNDGEVQDASRKWREVLWEDLLQPYGSILGGVLAVSTVGAGFTFSLIFTPFADPRAGFTQDYVRTCIAASWLLFIASIGITNTLGFTSDIVKRRLKKAEYYERDPRNTVLGVLVSAQAVFLILLPAGAFLASAEAVRAYNQSIGITAHALIVCIGLALLVATTYYCVVTLYRPGREDFVNKKAETEFKAKSTA